MAFKNIGYWFLIFLWMFASTAAWSIEQTIEDANELLDKAYESFRSGDVDASRSAAEQALGIGESHSDSDTVGGALTALCRVALRDNDAARIDTLTSELDGVAETSGNDKWRVYAFHMRAELARMNGNLDDADAFYVNSLELSKQIGLTGMVAAENFNRSFISVARGDLEAAREQARTYFSVSSQMNDGSPGAYGLIALANLLVAQEQLEEAAVVTFSTRRLFEQDGIIPDPADAAPLNAAETLIRNRLSNDELERSRDAAASMSVQKLVDTYL